MMQEPITLVGAIRPKGLAAAFGTESSDPKRALASRRESPLQYRMFFIWNDYNSPAY